MGTSRGADEPGAAYLTGGDGKRRSATAGGSTVQSRWDAGYTVLNEEDGSGALERTYVGRNQAQIEGSNASTGDYRYHTHDHLGSTRDVYDQSKNEVASFMYTPYGRELFATNRALTTRGFTGHTREAALGGGYYAPFRYYHPSLARWEKRDPLGMVDGPNVYAYVRGDVVNAVDLLGLSSCKEQLQNCIAGRRSERDADRKKIRGVWLGCQANITVACAVVCAGVCFGTFGVGCAACWAGCKAAQIAFCNLNRDRAYRKIEERFGRQLDDCRSAYEQCKAEEESSECQR